MDLNDCLWCVKTTMTGTDTASKRYGSSEFRKARLESIMHMVLPSSRKMCLILIVFGEKYFFVQQLKDYIWLCSIYKYVF